MKHAIALLGLILSLSGCSYNPVTELWTTSVAEFWRPISEPNLLLPLHKAQAKLDFDISQCNCAMFPKNALQPDLVSFQPDKQRYVETGITLTSQASKGDCTQQPSLVVAECMRIRGWERTTCTGRLPLASGGTICAAAVGN